MRRVWIAAAKENERAVGDRAIACQRHLGAVADDGRAGIGIGSREDHLVVMVVQNKPTRTLERVCINHVVIANYNMSNAVQGNGAVDRRGGAGIAITNKLSAIFEDNV